MTYFAILKSEPILKNAITKNARRVYNDYVILINY